MTSRFFFLAMVVSFFSSGAFAVGPCGGKRLLPNGSFNKEKFERRLTGALAVPGMCCTPFTQEDGQTCRGRIASYPEDVLIFIPVIFKPQEKTDIILHLHGHYAEGLNFEETVPRRFNFPKLLADTGRNSILVVPKSEDPCYTFEAKFIASNNKRGFSNFMAALDSKLAHLSVSKKPSIGSLSLTGHSGAFRAIDGILQQKKTSWFKKIEKVVMFEATYGPNKRKPKRPGLIDFVVEHGDKFTSVFIDEYDTRYGSEFLEKKYCQKKLGNDSKEPELKKCAAALEAHPQDGEPRFLRYSEKSMKGNPFNHEHYQVFIQTFSKLLAP